MLLHLAIVTPSLEQSSEWDYRARVMLLLQQILFHSIPRTTFAPMRTIQKAAYKNGKRFYQRIKSVNICRVEISPHHRLSSHSIKILDDASHVLRPKLLSRYKDVLSDHYDPQKEGLWIMCAANNVQVPKVVRGWGRRRILQAIVEELRERGFDRHGKRLETRHEEATELGQQEKTDRLEVLVGTLHIGAQPKILLAEHTEVRRQAGLIADEVLRICGWSTELDQQ
ncbi:hypothetical protein N7G274_004406 [Stereocaulon virgatum]|uniref:Uncharacterized protein n=1 Tax=Stereocaulon virgatum TaxID=373712 RepID=A0ABR4ADN4_9LECA